jgi:hypothetical protein
MARVRSQAPQRSLSVTRLSWHHRPRVGSRPRCFSKLLSDRASSKRGRFGCNPESPLGASGDRAAHRCCCMGGQRFPCGCGRFLASQSICRAGPQGCLNGLFWRRSIDLRSRQGRLPLPGAPGRPRSAPALCGTFRPPWAGSRRRLPSLLRHPRAESPDRPPAQPASQS